MVEKETFQTYDFTKQKKLKQTNLPVQVVKFAYATKTGLNANKSEKDNQDTYICRPHIADYKKTHFFVICDGHGPYGKRIADYCAERLTTIVQGKVKKCF